MKGNYNFSVTEVLKSEGGYTNDPNDNGGATNFGITIADYRAYIDKKGTASDVKNMTVTQAKTIYKSKYWDELDCDNLAAGVDYTCFDYGVNSGLGRPRKALQKFKSLKGTELIDAINNERMTFLRAIGTGHNAGFLKGWTARVARVRASSKKLASDNTSGPIAGVGTVGIFAALSQYWHQHEVSIIISGIVIALAVGTAIHLYRKK